MNIYISYPKTKHAQAKATEYFKKVKEFFPQSEVLANLDSDLNLDVLVCVPFDDNEWSMESWKLADATFSKGGQIYELNKFSFHEVDHQSIRPLSIKETKARELANFTFITPQEKAECALNQIHQNQRINKRLRDLGLSPKMRNIPKK